MDNGSLQIDHPLLLKPLLPRWKLGQRSMGKHVRLAGADQAMGHGSAMTHQSGHTSMDCFPIGQISLDRPLTINHSFCCSIVYMVKVVIPIVYMAIRQFTVLIVYIERNGRCPHGRSLAALASIVHFLSHL